MMAQHWAIRRDRFGGVNMRYGRVSPGKTVMSSGGPTESMIDASSQNHDRSQAFSCLSDHHVVSIRDLGVRIPLKLFVYFVYREEASNRFHSPREDAFASLTDPR
jgi:hypothetical protein